MVRRPFSFSDFDCSGGRAGFAGATFQPGQQVGPAIADLAANFDEGKAIAASGSPDAERSGGYAQDVGGFLVVAKVLDVGRDDFGFHGSYSHSPAWLRYECELGVKIDSFG